MNKITINFDTCTPAPSGGYNIYWRVAGSSGAYTNAGSFFISPAVFYDNVNLAGTLYEGYIQTDCNGVLGNPILWEILESGESGGGSLAVIITWDYVNMFFPEPGGHFRILVNSNIIIDRTTSDSGSIVVDIGDVIDVIVQNAVDRNCIIDITGPYTHVESANTIAEDEFTVEAGAYTIHGESL